MLTGNYYLRWSKLIFGFVIQSIFLSILCFFLSFKSIAEASMAISKAPILDVRRFPNNGSELVTQVLYNDRLQALETSGRWTRVRVLDQSRDGQAYPGWVESDKIKLVPEYSLSGKSWVVVSCASTWLFRDLDSKSSYIEIYFGTCLKYLGYVTDTSAGKGKPRYWLKCQSADGEVGWMLSERGEIRDGSPFAEIGTGYRVVKCAQIFAGTNYYWGGMTTQGIDCSGLTYMVFRFNGIIIPRDADDQFLAGNPVDSKNLQPGDLLFYGKGDFASHVTIYVGDGKMIEASKANGVQTRAVDFGHRFMGARRMGWQKSQIRALRLGG